MKKVNSDKLKLSHQQANIEDFGKKYGKKYTYSVSSKYEASKLPKNFYFFIFTNMDRPCVSLEKYQNIAGYTNQTKLVKNLLETNFFDIDDTYFPEDGSEIDTWITFANIETYINVDYIDSIINSGYAVIYSEYGVWLGMTYTGSVDSTISKLAEILFDIDLTDEELKKLKTNNTETEYMVVR